jgi:ankyrin repeat protein
VQLATALMMASAGGNVEMIEYLLSVGANVQQRGKVSRIRIQIRHRIKSILRRISRLFITRALIDRWMRCDFY